MIFKFTKLLKPITSHKQKWFFLSTLLFLCASLPLRAQNLEWAIQMGEITDPNNNNMGRGVVMDAEGNVYITGNYQDTVDFDPGSGTAFVYDTTQAIEGAYLAKYDSAGNYVWAKALLMGGGVGNGLTIDADGNLYVTGKTESIAYFETESGIDSIEAAGVFLAKCNADGELAWVKGLPGSASSYGCVAGRSGDVYIVGTVSGTIDCNPDGTGGEISNLNGTSQSNAFIAKYDASGNYSWAKGILGSGKMYGTNNVMDIAIDTTESSDNIYITGCFRGGSLDFDPGSGTAELTISNNARNAFLAKYDSSGAYIWAHKTETGTPSSAVMSYGVGVDVQGNVLITGAIIGSADFDPGADTALVTATLQDMFLAKYDAEGNYTWAQAVQGSGSISAGNDLAIDETGLIYVLGEYGYGAVDFDPGAGAVTHIPGGMTDMYVAKYGTCGTLLSVTDIKGSVSSTDDILTRRCALNRNGDLFVTGGFRGNIDFDPGTGTEVLTGPLSNGSSYRDIFLTKLHYNVDSNITSFLEISSCEDSFTFHGQTYTESGVYQQWLPGLSQCDSIVVLDLTLTYMEEPVITVDEFELGVVNSYDSYQWLKEGQIITGATGATYIVTENGSYQVVVSNDEGCSDTSAIYIVDNVGVADVDGVGRQISIYPNPTTDVLHINSPVAVTALLYSIEGRLLLRKDQARFLSLKELAGGIYLLQLTDKDGNILRHEKIVRQH